MKQEESVKQLKDLKIDDVIVIHDANSRGPKFARVRSVGRKYVYSNLMWLKGFDRETGRMAGNGVGNVHAITHEQEMRRAAAERARKVCLVYGVSFDRTATPETILICSGALEKSYDLG